MVDFYRPPVPRSERVFEKSESRAQPQSFPCSLAFSSQEGKYNALLREPDSLNTLSYQKGIIADLC